MERTVAMSGTDYAAPLVTGLVEFQPKPPLDQIGRGVIDTHRIADDRRKKTGLAPGLLCSNEA